MVGIALLAPIWSAPLRVYPGASGAAAASGKIHKRCRPPGSHHDVNEAYYSKCNIRYLQ